MGIIKDKSGIYLTEVEDIKKSCKNRQKKYTKKDPNDSYNCNDVITHLEADILECKVK